MSVKIYKVKKKLKLSYSLSCITITIRKTMCAVVHRHHVTHEHVGHWNLLAVQHSSRKEEHFQRKMSIYLARHHFSY